jgi:hypothetical protein
MSETNVIFVLLSLLGVLLLFGVFVNARRCHDVHRQERSSWPRLKS